MCDYQPRSQGPLLPVPAEQETGTGSRENPGELEVGSTTSRKRPLI